MSAVPAGMGGGDISSGCDTKFLWEQFETMGIDPEKDETEFIKFQQSLFDWASFAEYWLPNPEDEDMPLVLEESQKAAIRSIQFGYNIYQYPWVIPEGDRPKEIVMIWPRQFGKTTAVAIAAACAFIFMNKRYRIGTFSINEDGAKEIMDKIKIFVENSPFGYMVESSNVTKIIKSGGRVTATAYPASRGVRGRSLHLGLVDEAAWIDEEIMTDVVLKTFRRVGKRWILLSTPAGYRGEFIRHYTMGMETRPIVCANVVNGKVCQATFKQESQLMRQFITKFGTHALPMKLPNCPVCGGNRWMYGVGAITVVPVDPWTCSWKTREEIEYELWLAGNTPKARQEILGEIIKEGSAVFSMELLERAVMMGLNNVPSPRKNIKNYVIGMDFGKTHDASALNVMHYDWKQEKALWDYMFTIGGQYSNLDYVDIRPKFLQVVALFNPVWIVPDATGVGDPVMDDMWNDLQILKRLGRIVIQVAKPNGRIDEIEVRMPPGERLRTKIFDNKPDKSTGLYSKKRHKGFIFDTQSKIDLVDNLVEGYTKRGDIAIPQYDLPEVRDFWDEMLKFGYDITESKKPKYGTQSAHDDRVIAHALAYWACRKKPFVSLATRLA